MSFAAAQATIAPNVTIGSANGASNQTPGSPVGRKSTDNVTCPGAPAGNRKVAMSRDRTGSRAFRRLIPDGN